MNTIKVKAENIDGINGVFVKTGNTTISFDGFALSPDNNGYVHNHYVVTGVKVFDDPQHKTLEDKAYYAIQMIDSIYCGYFKRHSVTNIKIYEEGEDNNADCN